MIRRLFFLGGLSLLIYSTVAHLSQAWSVERFDASGVSFDRPVLAVVGLLGINSLLYLAACRLVLEPRARAGRLHLGLILSFAVAFRLVLLPSPPILEVDVYRYLWDGEISRLGVNPYLYSPADILEADREPPEELPPDLQRIIARLNEQPVVREILARVHYPSIPTIYPPVSQWVFRSLAFFSRDASLPERIVLIKGTMTFFEVATLGLTLLLLRECAAPATWLLIPAWCPLTIKETANSGHLDSIAVFFAVLACWATLRGTRLGADAGRANSAYLLSVAAAALALGTAAKIFPALLAPVLGVYAWQAQRGERRHGRNLVIAAAVGAATLLSVCLPYRTPAEAPHRSTEGLAVFARDWEMNDLLFALISQNVRADEPGVRTPWFVFVPSAARRRLVDWASPQWLSRAIFISIYTAVYFELLRRLARCADPRRLAASCYLALTWFWLCGPTCNPWYLSWGLPFLAFARPSAWLWLSGLSLAYYMRFWFDSRFPGATGPQGWAGVDLFDYGVVFLEFGPWLLLLAWQTRKR